MRWSEVSPHLRTQERDEDPAVLGQNLKEAKELAESCAEAKLLNEGLHKLFDKPKKSSRKRTST
jgi:hypothetical protein